jgi:hypothetical protein
MLTIYFIHIELLININIYYINVLLKKIIEADHNLYKSRIKKLSLIIYKILMIF